MKQFKNIPIGTFFNIVDDDLPWTYRKTSSTQAVYNNERYNIAQDIEVDVVHYVEKYK